VTLSAQLVLTQADATGLPLLYMYNRYPRQIKPSFWFGLMLYCASLFGASFARRTWLLVIFQGVLPGALAVQTSHDLANADQALLHVLARSPSYDGSQSETSCLLFRCY